MLIRWHLGERKLWGIVRVPTADDEDRRQLHRELIELKAQRTEHTNRIKGLLAGLGLCAPSTPSSSNVSRNSASGTAPSCRAGCGSGSLRELERWRLVGRQIHDLEAERTRQIRDPKTAQGEQVRLLLKLKGIGENAAWLLVREFFGWRKIRNRRELASLAGLTPTPVRQRGGPARAGDQQGGQSAGAVDDDRAGLGLAAIPARQRAEPVVSAAVRAGNTRLRKVGIVAVARKLLVALWKYLETGEVPAGAVVLEKRKFRARAAGSGSRRESDRSWESECLSARGKIRVGSGQ